MKSLDCCFVFLPLFCMVIFLTFPGVRCETSVLELQYRVLDNLTKNSDYDVRIRPNGVNSPDGPAVSHVNMYIRRIDEINEADMDYSIQVTFRQQWRDQRLQYEDSEGQLGYLTFTDHDIIWKPDLFFSNEKEGRFHNLMKPNVIIAIYPDGRVLYSARMSLVLSCLMDFRNFPMDTQVCSIYMGSYGYSTEDIVFLWKEDNPVQVTSNLNMLSFTLNKFTTDDCTNRSSTREYSCIKVDLVFKRVFSYYLYQFYIPFCILVILSWVTFWIDKNQVAARISLPVAALLAMIFLSRGHRLPLPKTSYTKAIDVWSGVCYLFAFSALLELATVMYVHRKTRQQNVDQESTDMDTLKLVELEDTKKNDFNVVSQETRKLNWRAWIAKLRKGSSKLDVISRILFPAAFVIFNIIYWSTYCNRS